MTETHTEVQSCYPPSAEFAANANASQELYDAAEADRVGALMSKRFADFKLSRKVAMRELDRVSGAQLDPSLVALFKEVVSSEPEWLVRFNIRREKD